MLYNRARLWVKCGVENAGSLAVDAPIRIKMATMDHSLDGSFYGDALYDYSGR